MTVKPVPDGYHTVTPYLVVRDAAGLSEFLQQVFDAWEIERMQAADGSITHAEVRIGDLVIMMGEVNENNSPMLAMLYLCLEDTDAYQRALSPGARRCKEKPACDLLLPLGEGI
jgi:uncharacterized glyoxalase superfamily protein PhnB